MPRSNRPRRHGRAVRPHGLRSGEGAGEGAGDEEGVAGAGTARLRGGFRRIEEDAGGSWVVAGVSAPAAAKTYRCPGCDQEIRPGTPHVVVWSAQRPLASGGELSDRRHWHTPCWAARSRRARR